MTNEQTNDITKDLAELANSLPGKPTPKSVKKAKTGYPIAFALLQDGQPFQYRSTRGIKANKTHAVLIPSGKYITMDGMKIVKVRKGYTVAELVVCLVLLIGLCIFGLLIAAIIKFLLY